MLGKDQEDLVDNLIPFFHRCKEYNLKLELSKSTFGYEEVSFIGYDLRQNSYKLDNDRKKVLESIAFPTNLKAMQSLLGVAVIFNTHVKDYATIVAPLYDVTKKDFNWSMSPEVREKY